MNEKATKLLSNSRAMLTGLGFGPKALMENELAAPRHKQRA